VVSAWADETGMVPGQMRVDEKTNEIKAIPELLEVLCPEGCIVTIDAMGTQKEIAKVVINKKADYILQEDISLYFKKKFFSGTRRSWKQKTNITRTSVLNMDAWK